MRVLHENARQSVDYDHKRERPGFAQFCKSVVERVPVGPTPLWECKHMLEGADYGRESLRLRDRDVYDCCPVGDEVLVDLIELARVDEEWLASLRTSRPLGQLNPLRCHGQLLNVP